MDGMRRLAAVALVLAVAGYLVYQVLLRTTIEHEPEIVYLESLGAKVRKLHKKLPRPQSGDWLATYEETGQTFQEYTNTRPSFPLGARSKIYVQPFGNFSDAERQIVQTAGEFLGLYYNLPVEFSPDMSISNIHSSARRRTANSVGEQLLAPYVLERILSPTLSDDAAALLALTRSDLFPDPRWNFVFGLGDFRRRVAVCSIARFGNPAAGKDGFQKCLLRTLKLSSHETGHLFGLLHCKAYLCNMCGTNSIEETDRHPLWLCPECMLKVAWFTNTAPLVRYENLKRFCEQNSLQTEQQFYEKSIELLKE